MGLLDQIIDELERRNAAAAPQPEEYSLPGRVFDRFKTGSVHNLKSIGKGFEAVGTVLETPWRLQSEEEYLNQHPEERPAFEKAYNARYGGAWDRSLLDTPRDNAPSPLKPVDTNVVLGGYSPIIPSEKRVVAKTPEELSAEERFGKQSLASVLKTAGSFYSQKADKILENNPQWEVPSHLRGRGALETLYAPDVTFKDKMTVLLGTLAESTPQVAASFAMPIAGGIVAGPPGLYAGIAASSGSNFLMETGNVYNELKTKHPGISEKQLADTAIAHGTVAAILETLPVITLLKRIPGLNKAIVREVTSELLSKPYIAKRIATGLVKQGLVEGTQEGLEGLSANVAKRVYDKDQRLLENVDESAFVGFLMGALTGGAESLVTHPSAVQQYQLSKLNEMSSAELRALADNPEAMDKEGYNRSDVIQSMRLISNLEKFGERQPRPVGVKPTDVEQQESKTEEFKRASEVEKKLRLANLPIYQLSILESSPKELDRYGVSREMVTTLKEEKYKNLPFFQRFEERFFSAPSEAYQKGMMSTIQGELYQKEFGRAPKRAENDRKNLVSSTGEGEFVSEPFTQEERDSLRQAILQSNRFAEISKEAEKLQNENDKRNAILRVREDLRETVGRPTPVIDSPPGYSTESFTKDEREALAKAIKDANKRAKKGEFLTEQPVGERIKDFQDQENKGLNSLLGSAGRFLSAQPETVQPSTVQPSTVQPETVQPSTVQPSTVQPSTVQPSTVQPETVQPSTVQPETVQPSTVQPVRSRVVASEAMSKEGALVSDWLKPFGEGKPIFLVDQRNLASEFEGLPENVSKVMRKKLQTFSTKGVRGFAQNTKEGYVIATSKTRDNTIEGMRAITTLSHEVGHYLHKQYLESAPEGLRKAIDDEYIKWKRKNKHKIDNNISLKQERRPYPLLFGKKAVEKTYSDTDKTPTGQLLSEYDSSFPEWFADEVAKALTSSEQSLSQVEQYFKKIGEMFRTLLQKVTGTNYMPTEIVRDFVLGGDFFIQRYSSGVQKSAIETTVAENEKSAPPTIERYNPTTANEVLQKVFNKPTSVEEAERKFLTDMAPEDEVSMKIGGDDRFFSLTNELNKAVIKEFTRGERNQEVTSFEKVVSSPEYYSAKDHTAFQMQRIASKKVENSHIFRKRVEGDSLLVIESAKKKTPEEYSKAKDYLIKADQLQSGMRVREINGQWDVYNKIPKVLKTFSTKKDADGYLDTLRFKDDTSVRQTKDSWVVVKEVVNVRKSFNSEKDAVYGPDGLIAQEVSALRKAGVNEDRIATIEAFRALTNRGFDLQVEELRRSGDTYKKQTGKDLTLKDGNEEISIQEYLSRIGDLRGSYFPRLRQESAFVLRASGEGKTNILETYNAYLPKNLLGNKKVQEFKEVFNNLSIPYLRENPVGKRIKELEAQGYELITLNPSGKLPSTAVNTVDLLAAMNNLIQHAFDTTQHTDSALSEEQIGKIESSFVGSIADALKIKGGHGSRKSRVDDLWEGYETDPLLAAAEYAQRVSSSAAMRDTAKKMILAFTGRETTWDQYKEEINPNAKYSEYLEYTKRNMISPTEQPELYKAMKDYMEYILTPSSKVDVAISKLQALALIKFIGLRLSSPAINLTNMYIAVPPTIASHTGLGLIDSIKHINSAAGKYSLYRLDRVSESSVVPEGLRNEIQKMATEKLTDADRAIFREIERRGWDEENFSNESQRVLQNKAGKAFQKTAEVMMYMFGATERANRATTIFAAYKAHEQSQKGKGVSKPDQELLYGLAHHTSNRAHGQYGEAAKPWLVQQSNLAAANYTFKKFQHNFILNMLEIGMKGFKEGNYTGAAKNVSYMLLAPAIVAGAGASAAVKLAFAVLGKLTGSDDPEEDFYKWFEDTFGESSAAARSSRYGLSGLVGVNLKGSISLDNPIPTNLEELGGAGVGVLKDLYDSAVHFSHKEWMKGAEKLSPNALGSVFRATREATEGLTTEGYAPKYSGGEVVKANFADTVARSLSFNPTRLATITDKLWAEKQVKAEYTTQRVDIKRRINKYLLGGSKNREEWSAIMGDIRQYNDRASATYDKYQNPIITDEWLETAIRDFYTPSASER